MNLIKVYLQAYTHLQDAEGNKVSPASLCVESSIVLPQKATVRKKRVLKHTSCLTVTVSSRCNNYLWCNLHILYKVQYCNLVNMKLEYVQTIKRTSKYIFFSPILYCTFYSLDTWPLLMTWVVLEYGYVMSNTVPISYIIIQLYQFHHNFSFFKGERVISQREKTKLEIDWT